jgi:hypothetical protein
VCIAQKSIDSAEKSLEVIKSVMARSPMRRQTVTPTSSLPSLMMPCPACAGRMVFHVRRPVAADIEDTIYACRSCGTELIRTSVRQKSQKAEAA